MVKEIYIKAKHSCPFLEYSTLFKQVYAFCSGVYDVLIVSGPINQYHLNIAKSLFFNVEDWRVINEGEKNKISFIIMNCLCDKNDVSITSLIQNVGGLESYPVRFEDGFEIHKIICVDEKIESDVLNLLQELPYMKILAINDLGEDGLFKSQMVSIPEIINKLTSRQIDILLFAYENGYYEIPRNVKTEDLAEKFQITRYGAEKQLRTAENKLIASLIPYLYFKKEETISKSNIDLKIMK